MIRLLVISDLHFGRFNFAGRRLTGWGAETFKEQVVSPLEKFVRDGIKRPADVLVVAGDIVSDVWQESGYQASTESYGRAERFLQNLCSWFQPPLNPKERLVIVPGNHDVALKRHRQSNERERVKEFRGFCQRLLGQSEKSLDYFTVKPIPELGIAFLSFDSTYPRSRVSECVPVVNWVMRRAEPFLRISQGRIGVQQLDDIEKIYGHCLKLCPELDTYYKIAVLHHHVGVCPKGKNDTWLSLEDDPKFQLACSCDLDVDMVIHGHRHIPYCLRVSWFQKFITVIGAGSLSHADPKSVGKWGNNLAIIDIEEGVYVHYQRYKLYSDKEGILMFRPDDTQEDRDELKDADLSLPYYRGRAEDAEEYHSQVALSRHAWEILNFEGDALSHIYLERLAVVTPNKERDKVRFHTVVCTEPGIIERWEWLGTAPENIEPKVLPAAEPRVKELEVPVQFIRPIKFGDTPLNIGCRCYVKKAFCMVKERFKDYYPLENQDNPPEDWEEVEASSATPCVKLLLELSFPMGYGVPEMKLSALREGTEVPIDLLNPGDDWKAHPLQILELKWDVVDRRISVRVSRYVLGQTFRLKWKLRSESELTLRRP